QARIMAQSDRNLVFHPGAKAHPPRQLRQQGHVEDQDRAVHRLLQQNHGQALPLDLRRKAPRRIAQPSSQKMSPAIPLGCTSQAAAYIARGLAYETEKDYDRAIADFGKAITLDPKNALAYFGSGS